MKAFFFQKTISYFLIFPTWKIFWFLAKKPRKWSGKTFLRNKTIWDAFYRKFATFNDFEKNSWFFLERPIYFKEKNPNFERFEKSYCCSRILWQICYNLVKTKFDGQKLEQNWPTSLSVNAIGKNQVRKRSDMTHLSGWFCFHII